jgi:hypothetical protein
MSQDLAIALHALSQSPSFEYMIALFCAFFVAPALCWVLTHTEKSDPQVDDDLHQERR